MAIGVAIEMERERNSITVLAKAFEMGTMKELL